MSRTHEAENYKVLHAWNATLLYLLYPLWPQPLLMPIGYLNVEVMALSSLNQNIIKVWQEAKTWEARTMRRRSTAIFLLSATKKKKGWTRISRNLGALTSPPSTGWLVACGTPSGLKRIRDEPERSVKVEAVWNAIEKKGGRGKVSIRGLGREFGTTQPPITWLCSPLALEEHHASPNTS